MSDRFDVYEKVTTRIIEAIEAGAGGWISPWIRPGTRFEIPKNVLTGNDYHGLNVLSTWLDAYDKGFERQLWATFKQWQELGYAVRKGEKGTIIVKYGEWTPKNAETKDGEEGQKMLYARASWVFNAEQVTDYPLPPKPELIDLTTRLDHVDTFISNTGASIEYGGSRAFYRPSTDTIMLPPRELFKGTETSTATEAFEATRLHEVSHWSGAKNRLNRDLSGRFGEKAYAAEELIAELSCAFLCSRLAITDTVRKDHAQYLAAWLDIMKADKRAIFTAASHAQKAADYLFGLQASAVAIAA